MKWLLLSLLRILPMLWLAVFLIQPVIAQQDNIYRQQPSRVKVFVNGQQQSMPWCGGANNPQLAMPDLNNDGRADLAIYEQGYHVRTFLNTGIQGNPLYVYAPEYEGGFPAVSNYMILADCNNDRIPDLFHYGASGMAVCRGYYTAGNKLAFSLSEELRYTVGNSPNTLSIEVNTTDVPAVADIDNDGDLDIVSFFALGAYVFYYRNMQVEDGLPAGTFRLKLADQCWGKMYQGDNRAHSMQFSCDNSNLKPEPAEKKTHGANAICLFDNDGDGDYDYLCGNGSFAEVQYLKNGIREYGYKADTMIAQDTAWSGTGSLRLDMPNFPIGYWLDIDEDGDKDLLFSPHAKGSENYRCIAYYKNTGSATAPVYTFQSDTFLISQMIDVGTGAYPVFYDYNRDGRKDMFVGSQGYFQRQNGTFRSSIAYYENTSSGPDIIFTLRTKDFLGLNAQDLRGALPAIGDIDRDGLDDLIIGKLDGRLLYFRNNAATPAAVPDWQQVPGNLQDETGKEIKVGSFAAPCIYDLDKDGHKDLVVGNSFGRLVYYRNNSGTTGLPALQWKTDTLGSVSTKPSISIYGFSVPFIGPIDNTGKDYLLVGSQTGALYRYDGFQNGNTATAYALIDSMYAGIDVGTEYTAPAVADLDGDGKYEMVIGNILGGLNFYSQVFNSDVATVNRSSKLQVYPNPVKEQLTISCEKPQTDAVLSISNLMGQKINAGYAYSGNSIIVNTTALIPGIYFVSIHISGIRHTTRFVKD